MPDALADPAAARRPAPAPPAPAPLAPQPLGPAPLAPEPLGPADAGAYAAHLLRLPERDRRLLFGALFGEGWLRAYAAMALAPGAVAFGARAGEGRVVVGAAVLVLVGGAPEITLSVEPGARGRGLGRALLRRASEVGALLGCPRAALRLAPEAEGLRALALSCGASLRRDGTLAELPLAPP